MYLHISDNDNDDVDLCDDTKTLFSNSCSKSLSAVADLRPLTEAAIDGCCQNLKKANLSQLCKILSFLNERSV